MQSLGDEHRLSSDGLLGTPALLGALARGSLLIRDPQPYHVPTSFCSNSCGKISVLVKNEHTLSSEGLLGSPPWMGELEEVSQLGTLSLIMY